MHTLSIDASSSGVASGYLERWDIKQQYETRDHKTKLGLCYLTIYSLALYKVVYVLRKCLQPFPTFQSKCVVVLVAQADFQN